MTLTNPAVPAALVLVAAVLTVTLARWLRASRRRRVRARRTLLATAAATVALWAVCGAAAANAWFDYLPTPASLAEAAAGVARSDADPVVPPVDRVLADPVLRARAARSGALVTVRPDLTGTGILDDRVLVWLPPQYVTEPDRRFPAVYLLHGSPGVPADFLHGGQVLAAAGREAAAGHPAVLVIPRMSRGWLDDSECVDGRNTLAATWLLDRVVPAVDAALRTVPTRAGRTVAGNSAGGYCALNLGLRHRDVFSAVLDLSGYTRPTYTGGMSALYGPDAARRAAQDDPSRYVAHLAPGPPLRVRMDVGREDGLPREEMRALVPQLRAHGVDVTYVEHPGAHTFWVWDPALAQGLRWALGGA
ncbi:MAG: alpha/beta hydrolase [Motilibacteraceae bacterium]